jgi:hypothetical protein
MGLLKRRPTETATGPPFGLVVFGYASTQMGLPPLVAGVCGLLCAFAPTVISETVDRIRKSRSTEGSTK